MLLQPSKCDSPVPRLHQIPTPPTPRIREGIPSTRLLHPPTTIRYACNFLPIVCRILERCINLRFENFLFRNRDSRNHLAIGSYDEFKDSEIKDRTHKSRGYLMTYSIFPSFRSRSFRWVTMQASRKSEGSHIQQRNSPQPRGSRRSLHSQLCRRRPSHFANCPLQFDCPFRTRPLSSEIPPTLLLRHSICRYILEFCKKKYTAILASGFKKKPIFIGQNIFVSSLTT